MTSFPALSWQSSLVADIKPKSNNSDPRFGRVASLILPRLYLSDFFTARDKGEMTRLGITHMVSVMERTPTTMSHVPKYHVPIADTWDADILTHLGGTTEFIGQALAENENNKVLVHCFQGISRSATVVCAYVIAQAANGMTAAEAIDFVRAKRGIVCPNVGFRTQLATYSEQFVGDRAKRGGGVITIKGPHLSKISEGIAQRMRRFKSGDTGSTSTAALKQVQVKDQDNLH